MPDDLQRFCPFFHILGSLTDPLAVSIGLADGHPEFRDPAVDLAIRGGPLLLLGSLSVAGEALLEQVRADSVNMGRHLLFVRALKHLHH